MGLHYSESQYKTPLWRFAMPSEQSVLLESLRTRSPDLAPLRLCGVCGRQVVVMFSIILVPVSQCRQASAFKKSFVHHLARYSLRTDWEVALALCSTRTPRFGTSMVLQWT